METDEEVEEGVPEYVEAGEDEDCRPVQEPPSENPPLPQEFGGNRQVLRIGVDGNGGARFQKIDKDQCR